MRTKLLSLKTLLVICLMAIVGGVETWADTYTYTFTRQVFKETSTTSKENLETQKLSDVSWTTSGVIPYLGFGGDSNGMQFGKKNNPADFSLTTSDIVGTITKVVVNASTATKNTVTLSVSVGGEQYGTEQITSTTSSGYTFSGKSTGKIAISMKSNGTKAMYIKSIEITYTPSSSSSVAAPTFSDDSKSFSDKFELKLSAGSDAAMIMYTTDGTTPSYKNNVGKLYEAPISITHSTTVKAIAISSKEEESAVVTNEYKLELPAPIISEETKTFTAPFTVSLSTTATAAEAILYTLDGTEPSRENNAAKYTEPIQISATTTLKAVSYATNGPTYEYSPIASATYTYTEQGDAPIVIWSEDWSGFKANDKPTQGENATYIYGGSNTKIYTTEISAGGESPELMIAKSGGSLAITINDLKGANEGLMFTFKTNQKISKNFAVSADNAVILSSEVEGSKKPYVQKLIMALKEGATSLTITLKNSYRRDNVRVDDLELSTYSGVGSFKITEAGYGTYYSSKAYTMPEGVKGYTITGNEGTSLVMKEAYAAGDVVPAKTALVVEGAANKYYTLVAASTELTPDNDNKLHGSDEAETTYVDGTDVKYYKLSYNNEGNNLGFYWGSENGAAFTNGAHKAYLALDSEKLLSQSRGFSLADLANGVTTGINTTVKSATQSNFIYDLNGRRINSLNGAAKGVYIMNGQKVLVK